MTSITIDHYLILAGMLFCTGLMIILVKRNAVFVLMGVELMLNAAHLNLAVFSRYDAKLDGQIMAVFSIVLAAAEAAIALAILLNVYKKYHTSDLGDLTDLKH
jgi:NADH-quinone oxidoreductase subunit K